MRLVFKILFALFVLILVISFACNGQCNYDTSLYREVVVTDIQRIMDAGSPSNKLIVISTNPRTNNIDTAFLYFIYVGKDTRRNEGHPVLMDREIYERAVETTKSELKNKKH